jgi:hypothetical protein
LKCSEILTSFRGRIQKGPRCFFLVAIFKCQRVDYNPVGDSKGFLRGGM